VAGFALDAELEDLLEQRVRGYAANAMFFCPFHDNTDTPAFSIHRDEGLWNCFGCGRKGNLESLYRQLGVEMNEDLKYERIRRSAYAEPEHGLDFTSDAKRYQDSLRSSDRGRAVFDDYCQERGIVPDIEVSFGIGWTGKALSLPYWTNDGRATGIKFRFPSGDKASAKHSHYGLYNVADAVGKPTVWVAEGESDTHRLWTELRNDGDIGVCGVSAAVHDSRTWSLWSIDLLFAARVFIAFDADSTGEAGWEVAARTLGDRAIRVRPTRGNDIVKHFLNSGTLEDLDHEQRLEGNDSQVLPVARASA
jgi:DNA primase